MTDQKSTEPKFKNLGNPFRAGWNGICLAIVSERNLRIHLVVAITVCLLSALLRLAVWEWVVITIVIFQVLVSELLNSALEVTLDRINENYDPMIGKAKDIGAAAVLLSSVGAATVGILIFGPKLWTLIIQQ